MLVLDVFSSCLECEHPWYLFAFDFRFSSPAVLQKSYSICFYGLANVYFVQTNIIAKGFSSGSVVKNLPAIQETQVQSLGREDPLDKEMSWVQYSCLGNPTDRGSCLSGYSP